MSRKHNTKHRRGRSHYPERLVARGETSASVRMRHISDESAARLRRSIFGTPDVQVQADLEQLEWLASQDEEPRYQ